METFHIADYITFTSIVALEVFTYTQIQGVKKEVAGGLDRVETNLKVGIKEVGGDLKLVRVDIADLKLEKAKKEGEEVVYARAKAELSSK